MTLPEHMEVDHGDVEEEINQNELRRDAARIRQQLYGQSDSGSSRVVNVIIRDYAQQYAENEAPITLHHVDILTTQHNEQVGLTDSKSRSLYCNKSYVLPMKEYIGVGGTDEYITRRIRHQLNTYVAELVTAAIERERGLVLQPQLQE